jgi:hypothetical protein
MGNFQQSTSVKIRATRQDYPKFCLCHKISKLLSSVDGQKDKKCTNLCHLYGHFLFKFSMFHWRNIGQSGRSTAVRHKEHVRYIRTNNPTSDYALHILNNKHDFGTAEEILTLLKSCHNGTRMNCWETFYMQLFHQNGTLINEQQVSDINPLYEIADTSRIPLHAP